MTVLQRCTHCGQTHGPENHFCTVTGHPLDLGPRLLGQVLLGRFEVKSLVGEGPMAVVLGGIDRQADGRPVAIKMLHPRFAPDASATERLLAEAQRVGELDHPNLAKVYAVGRDPGGAPFVVRELLTGVSLARFIREHGPLSVEMASYIVRSALSALQVVHAAGLFNGDLTAEDLFLTSGPNDVLLVKVLDFGQAHTKRTLVPKGIIGPEAVRWWAPEQKRSGIVNDRSDIFAAGAIFYLAVTGKAPYPDGIPPAPAPIAMPEIPSALVPGLNRKVDIVVRRAMALLPTDRYPSAAAFSEALAPFAAATPPKFADTVGKLAKVAATPAVSPAAIQTTPEAAPAPAVLAEPPTRPAVKATLVGSPFIQPPVIRPPADVAPAAPAAPMVPTTPAAPTTPAVPGTPAAPAPASTSAATATPAVPPVTPAAPAAAPPVVTPAFAAAPFAVPAPPAAATPAEGGVASTTARFSVPAALAAAKPPVVAPAFAAAPFPTPAAPAAGVAVMPPAPPASPPAEPSATDAAAPPVTEAQQDIRTAPTLEMPVIPDVQPPPPAPQEDVAKAPFTVTEPVKEPKRGRAMALAIAGVVAVVVAVAGVILFLPTREEMPKRGVAEAPKPAVTGAPVADADVRPRTEATPDEPEAATTAAAPVEIDVGPAAEPADVAEGIDAEPAAPVAAKIAPPTVLEREDAGAIEAVAAPPPAVEDAGAPEEVVRAMRDVAPPRPVTRPRPAAPIRDVAPVVPVAPGPGEARVRPQPPVRDVQPVSTVAQPRDPARPRDAGVGQDARRGVVRDLDF